jgi:toxin ParE1/3/4
LKSKRLVFRDEAEADLVALYNYIAEASGSFDTAFNFVERLRSACFKLEDFPEIGAARDEVKKGLRILALERKTVITYFVTGDDVVVVSNIFHGGRDWEAFFIGDLSANDGEEK